MTGGLIQLVTTGIQDSPIIGNPEITFFKTMYRQHTNFSLCQHERNIGTINFDKESSKIIEKNGDLLYNQIFRIEIPYFDIMKKTIQQTQNILMDTGYKNGYNFSKLSVNFMNSYCLIYYLENNDSWYIIPENLFKLSSFTSFKSLIESIELTPNLLPDYIRTSDLNQFVTNYQLEDNDKSSIISILRITSNFFEQFWIDWVSKTDDINMLNQLITIKSFYNKLNLFLKKRMFDIYYLKNNYYKNQDYFDFSSNVSSEEIIIKTETERYFEHLNSNINENLNFDIDMAKKYCKDNLYDFNDYKKNILIYNSLLVLSLIKLLYSSSEIYTFWNKYEIDQENLPNLNINLNDSNIQNEWKENINKILNDTIGITSLKNPLYENLINNYYKIEEKNKENFKDTFKQIEVYGIFKIKKIYASLKIFMDRFLLIPDYQLNFNNGYINNRYPDNSVKQFYLQNNYDELLNNELQKYPNLISDQNKLSNIENKNLSPVDIQNIYGVIAEEASKVLFNFVNFDLGLKSLIVLWKNCVINRLYKRYLDYSSFGNKNEGLTDYGGSRLLTFYYSLNLTNLYNFKEFSNSFYEMFYKNSWIGTLNYNINDFLKLKENINYINLHTLNTTDFTNINTNNNFVKLNISNKYTYQYLVDQYDNYKYLMEPFDNYDKKNYKKIRLELSTNKLYLRYDNFYDENSQIKLCLLHNSNTNKQLNLNNYEGLGKYDKLELSWSSLEYKIINNERNFNSLYLVFSDVKLIIDKEKINISDYLNQKKLLLNNLLFEMDVNYETFVPIVCFSNETINYPNIEVKKYYLLSKYNNNKIRLLNIEESGYEVSIDNSVDNENNLKILTINYIDPNNKINPPIYLKCSVEDSKTNYSLDIGTYIYRVTFYNSTEESLLGESVKITITENNKLIKLEEIPISLNLNVIGRRIYRTKVNGDKFYLLKEINNNQITVLIDDITDNKLGIDYNIDSSIKYINIAENKSLVTKQIVNLVKNDNFFIVKDLNGKNIILPKNYDNILDIYIEVIDLNKNKDKFKLIKSNDYTMESNGTIKLKNESYDKNYLYWLVNSKTYQENIKLLPNQKNVPFKSTAFKLINFESDTIDSIEAGLYKYKISFYNTITEEESLSSNEISINILNNNQIKISDFSPIFDKTFNSWKIYRTKKNGNIFYYLDNIIETENNLYIDKKKDNVLNNEYQNVKLRITQPINTHLINNFTRQLFLTVEYPNWQTGADTLKYKLEEGTYKYTITFLNININEETNEETITEETIKGSETAINIYVPRNLIWMYYSKPTGRVKITIPNSNNPNVTHINIYRTKVNQNDFFLLKKCEISKLNLYEYIDNEIDENLTVPIPPSNIKINTYNILKILNTEITPNLHSFISHSTDLTFANEKHISDLNDYLFNKPFIMLINDKGPDIFNSLNSLKQSLQTTNAYFYNVPFKINSSSIITVDNKNSSYLIPLSSQQFFNKTDSKYYSVDLKNNLIVETQDEQIIQKSFNPAFDEFNISNMFLNSNNYSYILIDQILEKFNDVIIANPEFKLLVNLIDNINNEFISIKSILDYNNLFGLTTKKILVNLKNINKVSDAFNDKIYNIDLISYSNLDYIKYSHYALELKNNEVKDINNIKLNIYDSDVNLAKLKIISPVYQYYDANKKISVNLKDYLKNVSSFFKEHIEFINKNLDYLNITDSNNYQEQFLSTNEITQHKYNNFYEYDNTDNQINLLHPIIEKTKISKINIKTDNLITINNFSITSDKTITTNEFNENILQNNFNDSKFKFENRNEYKTDKFNYLGLCHIDNNYEVNLDDKYIVSNGIKYFQLDDKKIYLGTADNTLGRYYLGKNNKENKLLVSSFYCSNPYELKFGDSNLYLELENTEGYYYKLNIMWDKYKEITLNEGNVLPNPSQNQYNYFNNTSDNLLYYSDGTNWIPSPKIVNAIIKVSNIPNYLNKVVLIQNSGYFIWGIQSNLNIECLFYINNIYHEGILENKNNNSATLYLKTKYVIDINFNELFYSNNLKSQLIKNITVEEFKYFNFEKKFNNLFDFDYFNFGNKYYTSNEIIKSTAPQYTYKSNPQFTNETLTTIDSFLYNKIFMYINSNDLNDFTKITANNGDLTVFTEIEAEESPIELNSIVEPKKYGFYIYKNKLSKFGVWNEIVPIVSTIAVVSINQPVINGLYIYQDKLFKFGEWKELDAIVSPIAVTSINQPILNKFYIYNNKLFKFTGTWNQIIPIESTIEVESIDQPIIDELYIYQNKFYTFKGIWNEIVANQSQIAVESIVKPIINGYYIYQNKYFKLKGTFNLITTGHYRIISKTSYNNEFYIINSNGFIVLIIIKENEYILNNNKLYKRVKDNNNNNYIWNIISSGNYLINSNNLLFNNKYCSIFNDQIIKNTVQCYKKSDFKKIIANNGDSTNNNIGSNNDYIIDNNNLFKKSNSKWNLITNDTFIIKSNNLDFNNKKVQINLIDFIEIQAEETISITNSPTSNGYYIYQNKLFEFTDNWNQITTGLYKIESTNNNYNNRFYLIESSGLLNQIYNSLILYDSNYKKIDFISISANEGNIWKSKVISNSYIIFDNKLYIGVDKEWKLILGGYYKFQSNINFWNNKFVNINIDGTMNVVNNFNQITANNKTETVSENQYVIDNNLLYQKIGSQLVKVKSDFYLLLSNNSNYNSKYVKITDGKINIVSNKLSKPNQNKVTVDLLTPMTIKNSVVYSYYQDYEFSKKLKDIDYDNWILLIDTDILTKRHFMLKVNEIKNKQIPCANYNIWILPMKNLPIIKHSNQDISINQNGEITNLNNLQDYSYYLIKYNNSSYIYYFETGNSIIPNDINIQYNLKAPQNQTINIREIFIINNDIFNTDFKQLVKIYDTLKFKENFINKELQLSVNQIIANKGTSTDNTVGNNNDYIIDYNNLYQKINSEWNIVTKGTYLIKSDNLDYDNKILEIDYQKTIEIIDVEDNIIFPEYPIDNVSYIINGNILYKYNNNKWNEIYANVSQVEVELIPDPIKDNLYIYENKLFKYTGTWYQIEVIVSQIEVKSIIQPVINGYYIYQNTLFKLGEWEFVKKGYFKIKIVNNNDSYYKNKYIYIGYDYNIYEIKNSLNFGNKTELYKGMTYKSSYLKTIYDIKYLTEISIGLEGDNLFLVTLFLKSKTNSLFLKYPIFFKKKEEVFFPNLKVYFNINESNDYSIIDPNDVNGTKYNNSLIPINYDKIITTTLNQTKITINDDLIIGKFFDIYDGYEIKSLSPYLEFNPTTKNLKIKSGYDIYNDDLNNQVNFFHFWKLELKNISTGYTNIIIFWTFFTKSINLIKEYLKINVDSTSDPKIGISQPYSNEKINNFGKNHILIGSYPDIFIQDIDNLFIKNIEFEGNLAFKYYTDTRHENKNIKYEIKKINYNYINNNKPSIEKLSVNVLKNINTKQYKNLYDKIMVYILICYDDKELKTLTVFLKSELDKYTSYFTKNSLSIYYTTSLPQFVSNPITIYPLSLKDNTLYSVNNCNKLYLEMGEIIIIDDNYFYVEGLNVFTDNYDLKLIRTGKDLIYKYCGYYTIGNYLSKNNKIIPDLKYDNINTYKSLSGYNDDSYGELYYSNIMSKVFIKNGGWLEYEKDINILNESYLNIKLLHNQNKLYQLDNFVKLKVLDKIIDDNRTIYEIKDIKDGEIILDKDLYESDNLLMNFRLPYQPFKNKYINFDSNGNILSEIIPDNQSIIFDYIIPIIANNELTTSNPVEINTYIFENNKLYKGTTDLWKEYKLTDPPVDGTYLIDNNKLYIGTNIEWKTVNGNYNIKYEDYYAEIDGTLNKYENYLIDYKINYIHDIFYIKDEQNNRVNQQNKYYKINSYLQIPYFENQYIKTNEHGKIFSLDNNLFVVRNNKINVDSTFLPGFRKVRIWETDYWSQFENVFDVPSKGEYHIDDNYPFKLKLKYDNSIGVNRFYFNKKELIINNNIFYFLQPIKISGTYNYIKSIITYDDDPLVVFYLLNDIPYTLLQDQEIDIIFSPKKPNNVNLYSQLKIKYNFGIQIDNYKELNDEVDYNNTYKQIEVIRYILKNDELIFIEKIRNYNPIIFEYGKSIEYNEKINNINKLEGYTNVYFYKYKQIDSDGKINNFDTLIGSYHLIIEKIESGENIHLAKIIYPNKLKIYTKFTSSNNDTIVNRVFNMKINNFQEFTYSPLLLTESKNLIEINNNKVEIIQKYNINLYDTPDILISNNITTYKYKFKELNNGINQIFQYIYTDEKLTNSCKLTVENNNKEYSFISNNYLSNDLKIIYTKLDNYLVSTTKNKNLKTTKLLNDKSLEKLINSNVLDIENFTLNMIVSKISPSKPLYYYKTLDNTNLFTLQTNQTYYVDKNNLLIEFINPNNRIILVKNVIDNDKTELSNDYFTSKLYVENKIDTSLILDSNILFNDVKQMKIKLLSNSYIDDSSVFNYLKPWENWSLLNSIKKISRLSDFCYSGKLSFDGTKLIILNDQTGKYITIEEYNKLGKFIENVTKYQKSKTNFLIMRNEIEPYILNNLTNWLYNPSFFLDVKTNINTFLNMKFAVTFDGNNILFNDDLNVELYNNEVASYITNEFTYDQVGKTVYRSDDSYNKINVQINNWINKITDNNINTRFFGVSIHKLCRYLVEIGQQLIDLINYFNKPFIDTPEYFYNNPLKFIINKMWEKYSNNSNINLLNKEFSDKMELKYNIDYINNILSSINYYNNITFGLTGIYSNNIYNNFTFLREFTISNLTKYDPNIFAYLKPTYKLLTSEIYPYKINFKGNEIIPNKTYSIDFLNGKKITEDIIITNPEIYTDQLKFYSSYNIKSTDFIVVKQNNEFTIKEITILGTSYLIKFNNDINVNKIDQIYYRSYNLPILSINNTSYINILVPYTNDEKNLLNEININDSFELRNSIGIKYVKIINNKQYLYFYSNKFVFIENKTVVKTKSNIYILHNDGIGYFIKGINIESTEYDINIITMVNLIEIKNMKEIMIDFKTEPLITDSKNRPVNDNIIIPFEYEIYNSTNKISINPIKINTYGDGKIIFNFTNDDYNNIIYYDLKNFDKIKQVKKVDHEITNKINNIELYDEYLYQFENYIEGTNDLNDTKIFLYNKDSTNLQDHDQINAVNGIFEPTSNKLDKTSIFIKKNKVKNQTIFSVKKNYTNLNNIYFIQKNSWIIQSYNLDSNMITIVISNDFRFLLEGEYYYQFGKQGQEKNILKYDIKIESINNILYLSFPWIHEPIQGNANFFQYYIENKIPVTKPINNRKAKITIDYPYQYKNNVLFYTLPYSGTCKEFGNYLYKLKTLDLSNNKLTITENSNYNGEYEGGICDEVIYLFKSGSQINGKLFDRFFDKDGYIYLIFSVDEKLDLSNQIIYTYRLADFVDKQILKLEEYQTSFNLVDYYEQTKSNEIFLLVKDDMKPYFNSFDLIQKPSKFYLVSYIPYTLTNIFNENKFIPNKEMQKNYSFKSEEIITYENINWKPVHKMFEYIRIYFNDQLMEELNEDVFLINYFLYYSDERRKKSNNITKIRKTNEEKWQFYIPLIFWFTNKPGLSIPLISLPYTQIRLVYKLNDIKNVVTNNLNGAKFRYKNQGVDILKNNPEMTIYLNTDFILLDTLERKLFGSLSHEYMIERFIKSPINFINNPVLDTKSIKLSGLIKDIHFIAKPINHTDVSYYPEVITNYDVRYTKYLIALNYYNQWIKDNKIYKSTDQQKYNLEIEWIDNINLYLNQYFNLTTKQINDPEKMKEYPYYDIQRLINQFGKWSIYDKDLLKYLYFFQVTYLENIWEKYYYTNDETLKKEYGKKLDYSLTIYLKYLYSNKKIVNEISPVESMIIKVDGTNLFAERDYRYFSDVLPYQKFKNSAPTGFYSYTFSLYPLEDQNSGHLNFSHFSNIELTVKSNQEAFKNYGSYNLNMCVKEYNILRIMSGLASTAWID